MSDFNKAIDFTIKNEGGFVDNKKDSGGPTFRGLGLDDLYIIKGPGATVEDLKHLTDEEINSYYCEKYWTHNNCHLIDSDIIAAAIFDVSVLYGRGTAASMAQKAANDLGARVQVDGHLGTQSIRALNRLDPKMFIKAYIERIKIRIDEVILISDKNLDFKEGWLNRAYKLLKLV